MRRCIQQHRQQATRLLCAIVGLAVSTASALAFPHHHEQHQQAVHAATPPAQGASITALMHSMWPGDLVLAAISEQDDIALVSWHYQATTDTVTKHHGNVHPSEQGDANPRKHGRALWRKVHGQWQLVSCAGKALMTESYLQTAGLTPSQAKSIVAKHQQAEAGLSPNDVALFDAFMQPQMQH